MPEQDLRISLVQTELYWENPQANLGMLEELFWEEPLETDLVILPEMFNSGFTMNPSRVAEPMKLTTHRWLEQQSKQLNAAMVGSFVVKEDHCFFNRLVFMKPDGTYHVYDKRHLFRMAGEDQQYSAGNQQVIVNWRGWNIMPQICYDLRFPVWSRNQATDQGALSYDLLLFIANWPQPRVNAWRTLLQARAIENLAYCSGVNRIGVDGMEVPYNGQSLVADAKGQLLLDASSEAGIFHTTLAADPLNKLRAKFPAHKDADLFDLYRETPTL